jgi:hypothetical protein
MQPQPVMQQQPVMMQQQQGGQYPQQTVTIGGQQGLMAPTQTISVQTAPMMMPMMPQNAMMVNSIIPGAPPTFMIDTSPQAMMANGFDPLPNVNPSGGGRNRTQRASRGGGSMQQQQQGPAAPPAANANVRVTVQKLG